MRSCRDITGMTSMLAFSARKNGSAIPGISDVSVMLLNMNAVRFPPSVGEINRFGLLFGENLLQLLNPLARLHVAALDRHGNLEHEKHIRLLM